MYIGVDGVERANNSDINMKIRKQLVSNEFQACVTDMVVDLQSAGVPHWERDDFDNGTYDACPECGCEMRPLDWERDAEAIAGHNESSREEISEYDVDEYMICDDCGTITDSPNHGYREVFEYYIVTGFLGRQLRDLGGMVLERWGGWIWGREVCGQAVWMDGIIGEVCERLEILDGQHASWADLV